MTSTTTTVVGWSLLLAVGGVTYWQYRSKNDSRRSPSTTRPSRNTPADHQRAGSKDRRRREKASKLEEAKEVNTSGRDQPKNHKKNKEGKSQSSGSSSAVDTTLDTSRAVQVSNRKEREEDDIAFAQQLASTQSGTTFKQAERSSLRVRTNKVKASDGDGWHSSGTSSAAGGDEDTSAPPSPTLNAASSIPEPSSIADMLEAPATGPTSLRITPAERPQHERTPRPAKPVQEEESKKQRQRRRKREAEKALTAENEANRRRLMEKQLKTAREAEGTAKSGQYRTYTPPTANAWGASKTTPNPNVVAVENAGLLDTFETDDMPAEPVQHPSETHATAIEAPSDESRPSLDSEPASSAAGSVAGNQMDPVIVGSGSNPDAAELGGSGQHSDAWEDYQMRTIQQREKDRDGWTEVPSKSKKKAAK